jgi:hypothetical protein
MLASLISSNLILASIIFSMTSSWSQFFSF